MCSCAEIFTFANYFWQLWCVSQSDWLVPASFQETKTHIKTKSLSDTAHSVSPNLAEKWLEEEKISKSPSSVIFPFFPSPAPHSWKHCWRMWVCLETSITVQTHTHGSSCHLAPGNGTCAPGPGPKGRGRPTYEMLHFSTLREKKRKKICETTLPPLRSEYAHWVQFELWRPMWVVSFPQFLLNVPHWQKQLASCKIINLSSSRLLVKQGGCCQVGWVGCSPPLFWKDSKVTMTPSKSQKLWHHQ